MNDRVQTPLERLEDPIDTDLPHSVSDVRDLAEVVRSLAEAIDDAIELINGAYEDTEDGGWDDNGADRFRASLTVGRTHASELESDARTFARKVEEYADALTVADERLERARDAGRAADLLDGKVIHPPEEGLFHATEGMIPPEEQDEAFERRRDQAQAYTLARAEFDAAVSALEQPEGIPMFAKKMVEQTYFSANSFIQGEIEQVAEWYNKGNIRNQLLFDLGNGSPSPQHLLPEVPDDLALRAVKSYGGSAINVFGVAFDIYTGSSVPKAVFVGASSALAGYLAAQGFRTAGGFAAAVFFGAASWTPPGWAVLLLTGGASYTASVLASRYWDELPEPVQEWMQKQQELGETKEDWKEWRDAYNDQYSGRGKDLKGP